MLLSTRMLIYVLGSLANIKLQTFYSDEARQNDLKRARITRADDAYLSNLVVDAGEAIDVCVLIQLS